MVEMKASNNATGETSFNFGILFYFKMKMLIYTLQVRLVFTAANNDDH